MLHCVKNILHRIYLKKCKEYVAKIYRDSKACLIFRTEFGLDTYVHPEKLFDIIESNSSCDAEPWMKAIDVQLSNLDVAIDVGANIGIVSLWLSRHAKKVYSFEPMIQNVEFLQKNIKLNNFQNIEVIASAVGDFEGYIDFYQRESFGHHGTTTRHVSKTVQSIKVPIIKLDEFCKRKLIERVSFLKIDVEGGELFVLEGFETYLKAKKVDIIVFEHAPVLFEDERQRTAVFDFLTSLDYSIFDMNHRSVDRESMLILCQGDFYAKPYKCVCSI
jgi:FkbM family methyltransferase